MRSIVYISLLVIIYSAPDTTVCGVGFIVSAAGVCSSPFGPCATSDFVSSVPTYPTRCLSCFPDAQLLQISTSHVCMPIACTSLTGGNTCAGCQNGYSLTINRSCILNFVSSVPTTNPTNLSATNAPDNTIPSLIIAATAVICVIICFIFKLTEQWKMKKDSTTSPQTVLPEIKDSTKSGHTPEAENSFVFVQSRNETELA